MKLYATSMAMIARFAQPGDISPFCHVIAQSDEMLLRYLAKTTPLTDL